MISRRIKELRECNHLSQAETAKILGITRSRVNAWESGIAVPGTKYVIELVQLFANSSDYLLETGHEAVTDLSGLDEESIRILTDMACYTRKRQGPFAHEFT
ncbi:helix-turn-helix transcriptional regulator [Lachnospiraceae bacterium 47-T17]